MPLAKPCGNKFHHLMYAMSFDVLSFTPPKTHTVCFGELGPSRVLHNYIVAHRLLEAWLGGGGGGGYKKWPVFKCTWVLQTDLSHIASVEEKMQSVAS